MSRKVSKQKKSFPKTDVRYWEGKVAFHTAASRTYCVQIQHANRRARINLKTPNKAQAALLARKLYLELCANGGRKPCGAAAETRQSKRSTSRSASTSKPWPQRVSFHRRRSSATRRHCARLPETLSVRQSARSAMPSDCVRSLQRRLKRGELSSFGRRQPIRSKRRAPGSRRKLHPAGTFALQR